MCYLIQNGADRFSFIFRGFGTGAMHVLCGLIVGGGLACHMAADVAKDRRHLRAAGRGITLHAIYNLLIAYGGAGAASPTPCRCCWRWREDGLFSAYRGEITEYLPWRAAFGGSQIF